MKTYWITEDGRILEVTTMSTGHLTSALNMLRRAQAPVTDPTYRAMEKELRKRLERAADAIYGCDDKLGVKE